MRKCGFTLAEVLITLAIIGVVAAMAIPSVIVNTQQQEFKTGLKKAVSVLNDAILMNIAIDGRSPLDVTGNNFNTCSGAGPSVKDEDALIGYFASKMSVMGVNSQGYAPNDYGCNRGSEYTNYLNSGFYTADGMRYEFPNPCSLGDCNSKYPTLYENPDVSFGTGIGLCGSYGLDPNEKNPDHVPCLVAVDVNGDKRPSIPGNWSDPKYENNNGGVDLDKFGKDYAVKKASPDGSVLSDMFSIMITDKAAIPYGTAAQRAMYNAK